ncbi:unnamed protein product [Polarella glacialis]|uniref:P-type ATPase A domain-containing protein n=2 Tax=Polarella glacialis TaxID=89957 RepID=A0A813DFJ3_POLGL|nr:unnamed protein product [Polarella glacialis]
MEAMLLAPMMPVSVSAASGPGGSSGSRSFPCGPRGRCLPDLQEASCSSRSSQQASSLASLVTSAAAITTSVLAAGLAQQQRRRRRPLCKQMRRVAAALAAGPPGIQQGHRHGRLLCPGYLDSGQQQPFRKGQARRGPLLNCNGHAHDHEQAHENSHEHNNEQSNNAHDHDNCQDHDHGHDNCQDPSHAHDHDDHCADHGHGAGHDGLFGHSHSHGEVPNWMPGASRLRQLSKISKSKVSMTLVATLFVLSLLPWRGPLASYVRLAGPAAVYLVMGGPALAGAVASAAELDIHFLMTVAAFASAVIGHLHEGALLLLLFALSESLENMLSMKARASLDALSQLSPETARRLSLDAMTLADAGDSREVPASELRAGDKILVRAGEVVPVDGKVLDGASQVGLSHLTGEPLPKGVGPGDSVVSGAVSIDGALLLEVSRAAHMSTIQRIARLTAGAKATRPRLVTLLDAVAERWSFAVVVSTIVIAACPPLLWHAPVGASLYRALVWLITASPCALILATPLVYVSGLSVAASKGVLLKGGRTLDALASASGIAFDKTGTLTSGSPALTLIEEVTLEETQETSRSLPEAATNATAQEQIAQDSLKNQQALVLAASLGRLSVHPVSRALAAAAPPGMKQSEVSDFQMVPGAGVAGNVLMAGQGVDSQIPMAAALGRPEFVAKHLEGSGNAGAELASLLRAKLASIKARSSHGSVVTALGLRPTGENQDAGPSLWLFHLEDVVKDAAPAVVAEVANGGLVYMLTGDTRQNAEWAAEKIGITHFEGVYADLRPEEKLEKVREFDASLRAAAVAGGSLRSRLLSWMGASVGGLIMVGDGINDAPALAAATAGISLEAGADGALNSNAVDGSDALVLRRAGDSSWESDLDRVAWLLRLARQARRIVVQNICLALCSIVGASSVTLASGMPLWLGVLLHEGTTVLVGLNSLRLFSSLQKPWRPPFFRRRRRFPFFRRRH